MELVAAVLVAGPLGDLAGKRAVAISKRRVVAEVA